MAPTTSSTQAQKQNTLLLKVISGLLTLLITAVCTGGKLFWDKMGSNAASISEIKQTIKLQDQTIESIKEGQKDQRQDLKELQNFRIEVLGLYGLRPDQIKVKK